MKDYYQILEIVPGSSADEIRQAYRKLAKRYHPDINKSPDAQEKFIEISEAYEVLLRNSENKERTIQTDHSEYEAFIRDIREAAQRQARMRYEKFAREHEAFRESGLYDIALLLKYLGKALLPFIAVGLISIPVIVSFQEHSWQPVFYLFFFWVIGGALLFFIFINLKGYFHLGKFYYNYERLSGFYKHTNESATEECFYCPGVKANSIPYKIGMVKVKDIKLDNRGPLQHYAGYWRKEFSVPLPRSQKAFIIHSFSSVIKLVSILLSLFLFPLDSLLWRFIAGIFTGWFINSVFLWISGTRSKSGYLFSYGMLIKIVVWLGVFSLISHFDFRNFNITTSDYIMFCFFILLFFDSLLEQVLKIPGQGALFRPIMPYYHKLDAYFDDHCQLYLEIPVWTSLYPFIRWIF